MAVGFLDWRGDAIRRQVLSEVDARMVRAGEAGAEEARRLCSVDTGQTAASIGWSYRQSDQTLQLHADTWWAVFVEFGTSRMRARPFLRPGMARAAQVFGGGAFSGEIQMTNTAAKFRGAFGHGANVGVGRPRGLRNLFRRRRTARLNLGR